MKDKLTKVKLGRVAYLVSTITMAVAVTGAGFKWA